MLLTGIAFRVASPEWVNPKGLTHSFASQKILENSAFYMLLI